MQLLDIKPECRTVKMKICRGGIPCSERKITICFTNYGDVYILLPLYIVLVQGTYFVKAYVHDPMNQLPALILNDHILAIMLI